MSVIYSLLFALIDILNIVLSLYVWILIVGAVLSWLVAFDVVNTRNRLVQVVGDFCFRLTEPVLKHIRRFVPPIGGMDLSPVVLIFAIWFIRFFLMHLLVS